MLLEASWYRDEHIQQVMARTGSLSFVHQIDCESEPARYRQSFNNLPATSASVWPRLDAACRAMSAVLREISKVDQWKLQQW